MDGKVLLEVLPEPGEVRRLTLGEVHEAVEARRGSLFGALWSIDTEHIDALKELVEDAGYEVRVL